MLPAMERIEVRDAVNAQDHRLAIDDENASAGLRRVQSVPFRESSRTRSFSRMTSIR
jgi:hypothetical protein